MRIACISAVCLFTLLCGCSGIPGGKQLSRLDACCIDPTPADAQTQKFLTGKVRMQSITFCTTR